MSLAKKQIAEAIDRPTRTVTYWTSIGLIHPDDDRKPVAGRARKYSERNLLEFAMVDYLSRGKLDLDTIKFIMDQIQPESKFTKAKMEYSNFFDESKWGTEMDLVYLEWFDDMQIRRRTIGISKMNEPLTMSMSEMLDDHEFPAYMARVISIGKVKQQALKNLNK